MRWNVSWAIYIKSTDSEFFCFLPSFAEMQKPLSVMTNIDVFDSRRNIPRSTISATSYLNYWFKMKGLHQFLFPMLFMSQEKVWMYEYLLSRPPWDVKKDHIDYMFITLPDLVKKSLNSIPGSWMSNLIKLVSHFKNSAVESARIINFH